MNSAPARSGTTGKTTGGPRAPVAYALVHLVTQQAFVELIEAQVLEPMTQHARLEGPDRPAMVVVAFLEPARVALRLAMRTRIRALRARAPEVTVIVLPFVSRFGMRVSATLMARRLRRFTGRLPVVFHCRGEFAVDWGTAIARHLPRAGIVADIRGIWPDELLLERGFLRYEEADRESRVDYDIALRRLQTAVNSAHRVLTVSDTLAKWLERVGLRSEEIAKVPCCVSGLQFSPATRELRRAALGLRDRVVLSYLGSIASYQHVEDGVIPFFRMALEHEARSHLLCITNEPTRMNVLLESAGIPSGACTVLRLPQAQVAQTLMAADAGLLLRAPTDVNRVSMPVKVAEYLAAGVPLIVSTMTGWVDELIEGYGAGLVIDWFAADALTRREEVARVCRAIRDDRGAMREGALRLCHERLVWSNYIDTMRESYVGALAASGG